MENENQEQQTQPTAAETEARTKGWRPQEEYSGDPSKWVDADEFLKRSPFYHEIGDLKRTLKKRDKEIEQILNYTKTQTEAAYKRGLAEAQSRLDAAVEAGDKAAVREINQEIVTLTQQQATTPAAPEVPLEVEEFQARNEWFEKDMVMTDIAIALSKRYQADNPRWSLERRLKEVEQEMGRLFPNKVTSRREAPAAVEGAAAPAPAAGGKSKYSVSKLTAEERLVHDQYVRRNIMSSEAYFQSLEQIEPGRFK